MSKSNKEKKDFIKNKIVEMGNYKEGIIAPQEIINLLYGNKEDKRESARYLKLPD